MQHMTALTKALQIGEPVVGGIVIQMRCRQHDAGQTEMHRVDQVGPARLPSAPVPPGPCGLIEPAPVREATDSREMRPAASLTTATGTLESNTPAQRCPVRRIERAELRTNRHGGYAAALPGAIDDDAGSPGDAGQPKLNFPWPGSRRQVIGKIGCMMARKATPGSSIRARWSPNPP